MKGLYVFLSRSAAAGRLLCAALVGVFWLSVANAATCYEYEFGSSGRVGSAMAACQGGATPGQTEYADSTETTCYLKQIATGNQISFGIAKYPKECDNGNRCEQTNGKAPPLGANSTFAFGGFAAPSGKPICSDGCVYVPKGGECASNGNVTVKWYANADGTGPLMERCTAGDFAGNGTVCDQEEPEAYTDPKKDLAPPGKCPGVGSLPGGGTATMFVDCASSVTTTSGSSTRSVSVGSETVTLRDDTVITKTCSGGTCTTTISQTTTAVTSGGGLNAGDKTTGTSTSQGAGGIDGVPDGTCKESTKDVKCGQLDAAPDEKPGRGTQSFTYTPHAWEVWGGSDSCPADVVIDLSVIASPITFSYEHTCDILETYVKPLILALSAFAAVAILYKPS